MKLLDFTIAEDVITHVASMESGKSDVWATLFQIQDIIDDSLGEVVHWSYLETLRSWGAVNHMFFGWLLVMLEMQLISIIPNTNQSASTKSHDECTWAIGKRFVRNQMPESAMKNNVI